MGAFQAGAFVRRNPDAPPSALRLANVPQQGRVGTTDAGRVGWTKGGWAAGSWGLDIGTTQAAAAGCAIGARCVGGETEGFGVLVKRGL